MHRPFRFTPPPLPAANVPRSRLLAALDRRFDLRLITIEAGAGLGKTTVLGQAVTLQRDPDRGRDVWLGCEPADGSASTFLTALLRALGAPDVVEVPRVEHVCEAVWSLTPTDVCLVLDDVHHLDRESPGEMALRQLVDELPENGHLVLAGRSLTGIERARLLLHDRALELTEPDLRLDHTETAAVAAAHGVAFEVVDHAGGWVALAALHARAAGGHADRFVWEEVVTTLPEHARDPFLLLCAIGGGDAEMVRAVIGDGVGPDVFATLPLVDADDRGGVRPHRLWQEVLGHRVDADAVRDARRRAAAVLAARGDAGNAFELLAAGDDWDEAILVLFAACNAQQAPPWLDQMERWRRLIPADVALAPQVTYLDAMIERERDPWAARTRALFAAAMASFRARGDVGSEIVAGIRATFLDWVRGDAPALRSLGDRGRELVAVGVPMEAVVLCNEAAVADIEGRTDDVRAATERIGEIEPRLRHVRALLRVFAGLADGASSSVRVDAVAAAQAAQPVVPAAATGWATLAPALVAWTSGDLAAVIESPPVDPGPRYAVAERLPAVALAAITAAHLGDVDAVAVRLAELDRLAPDVSGRDLLAGFRAVAGAAAAAADGDDAAAALALHEGLDGLELAPAGAGRAVRWFPSLPYLFHPASRELLDRIPSGPSRGRTLAACRALLDGRAGRPVDPGVLADADVLVTALPARLAVELVVRAAAGAPSPFHVGCIAALVDRAPRAVRDELRALASEPAPLGETAMRLLATVPIPPSEHLRIEVLGPARLLRDGIVVDDADWRRQRVRQLVCALVAMREVRRERLGVLLWPEFDEKAVSANLRMTLSYLQGLLEPNRQRGDAPWFLQQSAGVLRLRADGHLSIDAWELEDALDAADAHLATGATSAELAALMDAVGLWRGDYLDDVAGEEWAEPARERVRQRVVRAAVRAGELLVASGRIDEAVRVAETAQRADPWSEPAIRLAVTARLASGDRSGARQAYENGRRVLIDLGVEPEPATEELARRLRDPAR